MSKIVIEMPDDGWAADIMTGQRPLPQANPKPRRTQTEDFKVVFDKAVEQIKNQSEIAQPPGLFKDHINPEAVKSQWTVGAKAVF